MSGQRHSASAGERETSRVQTTARGGRGDSRQLTPLCQGTALLPCHFTAPTCSLSCRAMAYCWWWPPGPSGCLRRSAASLCPLPWVGTQAQTLQGHRRPWQLDERRRNGSSERHGPERFLPTFILRPTLGIHKQSLGSRKRKPTPLSPPLLLAEACWFVIVGLLRK